MNLVKIEGCKINIQKSIVFLYASNKLSEKERKTIPVTVASIAVTFLGINFTEEVKDLYTENYT